ncbi:MAG: DUF2959 family protein [Planctomycetota bacterium]|jgi:hypothetical protein
MHRFVVAMLAGLILVGCESGKTEGQKTIDELSSAIGGLKDEMTKGRAELKTTVDEYALVVDNKDGDLIGHFQKFNSGLETVEQRRQKVRAQSEKLDLVAQQLWAQWDAQLAKFSSEDMKKRAMKRKEDTQAQFKKIDEESKQAREAYERMMTKLRDHANFLSVDLNKSSVAELSKDWPELKKDTEKVFGFIDGMLKVIGDYETSIAMKTDPEKAPGCGAGEGCGAAAK